MISVSRFMAKTVIGAIGYLIAEPQGGELLTPVLCFHSSPRCSDEFLEVLPMLASHQRRVVAIDCPGYGVSENPVRSCTIDEIADAMIEVADSLGIEKFVAIGNLMGNFIGVSLAARNPDRIAGMICTNLYYFPPKPNPQSPDPEAQSSKTEDEMASIPDSWVLHDDGSHLGELFNKRKGWLDTELNTRVTLGELTYLVNRRARYAKGIKIQDLSAFDFETASKQSTCPVLCVKGEANLALFDQIGYQGTQQFEAGCKLFSDCQVVSLSGPKSTLNLINQTPEEFTSLCLEFLKTHSL